MNQALLYYIITIFCTAVNTYILYRYYHYILPERISPKRVEVGSYLACFLLNILNYFLINIPVFTLILCIVTYTALAFNYEGRIKHKISAGVIVTLIFFFIETAVVFVTTAMNIDVLGKNDYTEISGQIFTTIFTFMVVEIIGRRRSIKSGVNIPFIYWVAVLITPVCSYVNMVYLISIAPAGSVMLSVCCLLFLFINISVFFLYGRIIDDFDKRMQAEILRRQSRYYANLAAHMRSANEATATMRHNWKHHLITMEQHIKNGNYDQLTAYLDSLGPEISAATTINSGNDTIDAILNYKIEEAKQKNVAIHCLIDYDDELEYDAITLTIILANLLDNAIEAAANNLENKEVSVLIRTEKGVLILKIKNKYEGELKREKETFLTSKSPEEEHGKGLKSVIDTVNKNGGVVKVQTEDQTFRVAVVILPKTEAPAGKAAGKRRR